MPTVCRCFDLDTDSDLDCELWPLAVTYCTLPYFRNGRAYVTVDVCRRRRRPSVRLSVTDVLWLNGES